MLRTSGFLLLAGDDRVEAFAGVRPGLHDDARACGQEGHQP